MKLLKRDRKELANAHLIAAAPDLLNALRTMALLYSDSHLHMGNGSKCAICEAEDAINKAMGLAPVVRSAAEVK